jgi:hypothetical protein
MSADDLYDKWFDDQEETNSKWEIVKYFTDNYLKTEEDLQKRIEKIGVPNLLNNKADEFYNLVKRSDTGPKDIIKFIIDLNIDFPENIKGDYVIPIIEFLDEKPSLEQYVTYFQTKFPKILERLKTFASVFSTIITLANKKLINLNFMNTAELLIN